MQIDDFVKTIDSDDEIDDLDQDEQADEVEEAQLNAKQAHSKKKRKRAEDGEIDNDFVFEVDGASQIAGVDGWSYDSAALTRGKDSVDLEEIIKKRKLLLAVPDQEDNFESDEDPDNDSEVEDDFDEDEFTGFGDESTTVPNSVMDDEEEAEASPSHAEESSESAAEEEISAGVAHPDDLVAGGSDAEEEEEVITEAEKQRRKDFFAPEEEQDETDKSSLGLLSFQHMNLSRPILRALTAMNFSKPTPIQAKSIPVALMGKDVVGGAVTGSGKTAAFMIPILERLLYRPKKISSTRVLVLCPTRELAMQCHAVTLKLAIYTDVKAALVVGGLSLKVQEAELRTRPDIVIATPGRFIDHFRNSQGFTVENIEIMVMDEADRMLEEGFADELNEIINACPRSRQTMLFSATMTEKIDDLIRLSLNRPVRLMVDAKKSTAENLVQEFVRIRPQKEHTRSAILVHLCSHLFKQRVIVFFRSKVYAHRMRVLLGLLGMKAGELHGNLSQEQRVLALESFRDGKIDFLMATDLASRGLDIKGIDTVINYEAPQSHEIYLHRVGRTARAGRNGRSVTLAGEADRKVVKAAVKSSTALKSKVQSRSIDAATLDALAKKIAALETDIEEILKDEAQERQLKTAEMELRKGENAIKYQDEIASRPRRTWFATDLQKKESRDKGASQLNPELRKPKTQAKPITNKDKKRLDDRAERKKGGIGKKKHSSVRQK